MNDKWHRLEIDDEPVKFNVSNIPEINNKEIKHKVSYMLIGFTYLIFIAIKSGKLEKLNDIMKNTANELKGGDKGDRPEGTKDNKGYVGWSKE